jgi:hypothetical protein
MLHWNGGRLVLGGLLVVLGGVVGELSAQDTAAAGIAGGALAGGQALASAVNDPTAPITLLQLRDVIAPPITDSTGTGNLLELQFVEPIGKGKLIPLAQLTKTTLPFLWTPGPGSDAGFGDISFFDIGLLPARWGRWGFGVALVFPTASSTTLGQGKWQVGPAFGLIISSIPNLQFGLVMQNPISFAGASDRPSVNSLSITPTLTYNFPGGWFAGYSDFAWSFNWEANGTAAIPLGAQFGKVVRIGKRHFVFSAEGGKLVSRPGDQSPEWLIGIEAAWVLKTHFLRH